MGDLSHKVVSVCDTAKEAAVVRIKQELVENIINCLLDKSDDVCMAIHKCFCCQH